MNWFTAVVERPPTDGDVTTVALGFLLSVQVDFRTLFSAPVTKQSLLQSQPQMCTSARARTHPEDVTQFDELQRLWNSSQNTKARGRGCLWNWFSFRGDIRSGWIRVPTTSSKPQVPAVASGVSSQQPGHLNKYMSLKPSNYVESLILLALCAMLEGNLVFIMFLYTVVTNPAVLLQFNNNVPVWLHLFDEVIPTDMFWMLISVQV